MNYFVDIDYVHLGEAVAAYLTDAYSIHVNQGIHVVVLPRLPSTGWPEPLPIDEEDVRDRDDAAWLAAAQAHIAVVPSPDGNERIEKIVRADVDGAVNVIVWISPPAHDRLAKELAQRLTSPSAEGGGWSTRLASVRGTELGRFLSELLPNAVAYRSQREVLGLPGSRLGRTDRTDHRIEVLMSARIITIAVLLVGACKFPELPPLQDDAGDASTIDSVADTDGVPIDAITIDTPPGQSAIVVDRAGFGTGTVVGTVPPLTRIIDCGGAGPCSAVVDDGTMVTLTAMAAQGDRFFGWSGGGCSGTGMCVTTVASMTTVTATFDQCDRTVSESCDNATDQYEQCSTQGQAMMAMRCPLYCSSTVEKCVDIGPSDDPGTNPLDAQMDLLASSGQNLAFPNTCTAAGCSINADGSITGATTGGGAPSVVLNGVGRVYRLESLNVQGVVKVRGNMPVIFLVNGGVAISGILDASADFAENGPGAQPESEACTGARFMSSTTTSPGGGGGGGYFFGGGGGNSSSGLIGANGGSQVADLTLIPLVGGCMGGYVTENTNTYVTNRGGGGGAIQIVSRGGIMLVGNGVIDVSGGGGLSGDFSISTHVIGGCGGGSGGSILLESPTITLDGVGVALSAKGGGGAAAGTQLYNGADGGYDAPAAAGGLNPNGAEGGNGGTESIGPQRGENAESAVADGGGGGGSVGRCRLNTRSGAIVLQNGAAIRCARATNTSFAERLVP